MLGALNSASAISAALRIAWPATPALPPADSGRMSADLDLAGADGRARRRLACAAACGGGVDRY